MSVSGDKLKDKVNICGVAIDNYAFTEVIQKTIAHILSVQVSPQYIVTPNADHILQLQDDAILRRIYQNAFLVVPDGVSLLWAAKLLSTPLKERVNGTDLFEALCATAAQNKLRVFLMGGRPGSVDKTAVILQTRYPDLQIVDTDCPPYGFEKDSDELARIKAKITRVVPHLLFVGLGTPKQEKWIYENYRDLNVPMAIGIGASFEFVSGIVARAPNWMQKVGLEWFFRLFVEPRRLWKRYIIGNPLFLWRVLKQKLGRLRLPG